MITAIIAGIVILIAGIKWVGSSDDPAARGAARLTIIHVIIGLIIIVIALALVAYLLSGMLGGIPINITAWLNGCGGITSCT